MPFTIPKEILVAVAAASPILEIKGSIPLGRLLGLPLEATLVWSIIGNILPIFPLLKFMAPLTSLLATHSKWFNKFLSKVFTRTRAKHTKRFEQIGALLLILVVAIPFPGSGAWTAAIIAHIYNVPYWKAMLLITIGTISGTILLSALVYGVAGLEIL